MDSESESPFHEFAQKPSPHKRLQIGAESFATMRERESKAMGILHFYTLTQHPEVENWKRAILVDWVMEVCSEFLLQRRTYHLAVTFIDL